MPSRDLCTIEGCEEHYACRLRAKGTQVSPRAQSTRTLNWRPTKSVPPAANRELMYDVRPDGTKMPIRKPDGTSLYKREYRENQAKYDDLIRRTRTPSGSPS